MLSLSLSSDDKLWCSLSPPLTSISKKVFPGIRRIGLVLEIHYKAGNKTVMLVEDKIHWVELDQKKHRISGKLFFLLWNRWHRVIFFGWTETIGWAKNNKLVKPSSSQRKHLSPQLTRLVRSHKDLQGILLKDMQWIGCRKCRANRKKSRWSFFERGNKYAWDKCKSTEKKHERTSSRIGRWQSHLC